VLVVTERLLREFASTCTPQNVLACIADSDGMLRAAGVRNGLGIALESMVRARLRDGCGQCASLACVQVQVVGRTLASESAQEPARDLQSMGATVN
jgi:hypothetical protein